MMIILKLSEIFNLDLFLELMKYYYLQLFILILLEINSRKNFSKSRRNFTKEKSRTI